MDQKLSQYLRAHRLRSGLSQRNVAFVLGLMDSSGISKLERAVRTPERTRIALGAALLFGVPVDELFPGFHKDMTEDLGTRAYELHRTLQGKPSRTVKAKLDFLEAAIERARLSGEDTRDDA